MANSQLEDALGEIKEATHRYLFWTADVNPLSLSYPLEVARDLNRLLSLDTLGQLGGALMMMVTSRDTVLPILGALLLVGFSVSSRRHYNAFLARAAGRVGKVTQDHFTLTLRTVFWSILVALPLPVLWGRSALGCSTPALPGRGGDRRRRDRHAAAALGVYDQRRLRPTQRAVCDSLPLAAAASGARHALLLALHRLYRAADYATHHLRQPGGSTVFRYPDGSALF